MAQHIMAGRIPMIPGPTELRPEMIDDLEENVSEKHKVGFIGITVADLFHRSEKILPGMKRGSLVLEGDIEGSIDRKGEMTDDFIRSLPEEERIELLNLEKLVGGGPAYNSARICAQIRGRGRMAVKFISSVGSDEQGIKVTEDLSHFGIDVGRMKHSDKPVARTLIFEHSGGERSFLHNIGASEDLKINDLSPEDFKGLEVVEFGGVELAPNLMKDLDKALKMAKDAGAITVFDTVADPPRQWKNYFKKEGYKVLELIDVLATSIGEARQIYGDAMSDDEEESGRIGRAASMEKIIDFFVEHGTKAIFLKVGKEGSYIRTTKDSIFGEKRRFRVPILRGLKEISGTGTGDAYVGALVYAAAHKWGVRKAARFAAVVGGMAVEEIGGSIGERGLLDALKNLQELEEQSYQPYTEKEIGFVIESGKLPNKMREPRRFAASLVDVKTRELVKKALKVIGKMGLEEFIDEVVKESFNIMYRRALPGVPALPPEGIEVAGFGRGDFDRVGLLLQVVSIHSTGEGRGHTGKVSINLPGQFLPEHRHTDVVILRKGEKIPKGYRDIRKAVPGFEGIREYESDGAPTGRIRYSVNDYEIALADSEKSQIPPGIKTVELIEGKSETFMFVDGEGILFLDKVEILYAPEGHDPYHIPVRFKEKIKGLKKREPITAKGMIHVIPGMIVLLPKNTRHSVLAGDQGAGYLEFSSPSLDEADHFTDKRVRRLPVEGHEKFPGQ